MVSEENGRDVVLVTGSAGLIGSALIRSLADRYRVVGFDREGPPFPPSQADCVFVDLTSDESVQNALLRARVEHGRRIASVVHLAAYYDFSGAPSDLYERVTVRGTERLLRELRDFEVEQFIFSSTMLVHAPTVPGRPISEVSPLAPAWPYPESKVRTEELILKEHGTVPCVLLRLAGVYDDLCHSIPLAQQIVRVYERRLTSRLFPGDPSHGQSFVHLEDVVRAIQAAVDRRRELPSELTLLVGEPKPVSYGEMQEDLGRLLLHRPWKTHVIPKPLAKAGAWLRRLVGIGFIRPWMIDRADDHYELDIGAARKWLHWEPRRDLRSSLPRMIDAVRRDPEAWLRANGLKEAPRRQAQ